MFNSMLNNATPEKVGTIKAYGGETAPVGWLICDGSAISRELYAELFGVIGTTYGAGDGSTTFNIPNGVVPVGSVAPAKGNNIAMGFTDSSNNYGLCKDYINPGAKYHLLSGATSGYGGQVGKTTLANISGDNEILYGLTTDPTKSGIVCDLTLASAASMAIIKY